MNPIDVLEEMSRSDTFVYSPLLFGYVNYSRLDTHGAQIVFGNVPIALEGPAGALLGGVGIAVSASCAWRAEAVDYAWYVASPHTQRTIYFDAGGQPAHHSAWADVEVDRLAGQFFSSTRPTIDGA